MNKYCQLSNKEMKMMLNNVIKKKHLMRILFTSYNVNPSKGIVSCMIRIDSPFIYRDKTVYAHAECMKKDKFDPEVGQKIAKVKAELKAAKMILRIIESRMWEIRNESSLLVKSIKYLSHFIDHETKYIKESF